MRMVVDDARWNEWRNSALRALRPGALVVNMAADRVRGQEGRAISLFGVRANTGDPDYPLPDDTGEVLRARFLADPLLRQRLDELEAIGFALDEVWEGEPWWEGVHLAVRPSAGSEIAFRTAIKTRLGYLPPDQHCQWDRQFEGWIEQRYNSTQREDGPFNEPPGLIERPPLRDASLPQAEGRR